MKAGALCFTTMYKQYNVHQSIGVKVLLKQKQTRSMRLSVGGLTPGREKKSKKKNAIASHALPQFEATASSSGLDPKTYVPAYSS